MRVRFNALLPLLLAPGLLVAGCTSLVREGTADVAGVAAAGAASAVTSSAAGAAAIGLGVRSVAAEGLRYVSRRLHRAEQDAIAAVAGTLAEGAVAPWSISHTLPLEEDEQGEVTVTRRFGTATVPCRELVFSVQRTWRGAAVTREYYVTTICNDGARWRWAAAEPATERWGSLQ